MFVIRPVLVLDGIVALIDGFLRGFTAAVVQLVSHRALHLYRLQDIHHHSRLRGKSANVLVA